MTQPATDEEAIFFAAVERPTFEEQTAYIEAACAKDPQLRDRVRQLLELHAEAAGPLDAPPPELSGGTVIPPPISEGPGTVIGRYKLLELIGEGGFGAVYMAEQAEPVRRRVALKIIKLGMDTRQVIARFEAERQALALMDHPNIAKVLEAGATETGRPYFVMELVRGIAITDYCDKHNLTTEDRLKLFIDVCRAVQHAHQKGIIHRDIKPTNVMVTQVDGESLPKVIDFGIAKATQQRLTEKTLYTSYHQFIGTPQYMSPEQAAMSGVDVDTRSDIYSLGVLLYELLVGTTPFDPEALRNSGYDKMCRIISETEPPTPSQRVSTLGAAITTVSEHRQVEPAVLTRQLRGDLDWIVMKALEKRRDDRYATAHELAEDVERHLRNEPIQARRPSLFDQIAKWSRRHRAAVWSTLAVLTVAMLSLAVGTFLIARAYQRESEQRVVAEVEARRAAESEARASQSDREAREVVDRIVTQTAERLRNMPHVQQVRHDMLEQALEFYNRFLEQRGNDPELRHDSALAWLRISRIQGSMGHTDKASTACEEAIRRLNELVVQDPAVASYQADLAASHYWLACCLNFPPRRPQDAIRSARRAVELYEQLVRKNPDNRDYRSRYATTCTELGRSLERFAQSDRFAMADQAFRQALRAWSTLAGASHKTAQEFSEQARSLESYGGFLRRNYRFSEAEEVLREAFGLYDRALAEPQSGSVLLHIYIAETNRELGGLLAQTGRFREAERCYGNVIATYETQIDQYPTLRGFSFPLAMCLRDLSDVLLALQRASEAKAALRRSIELSKRMAEKLSGEGMRGIEIGTAYYRLGCLHHHTSRAREATAAFEKAQQALEDYVHAFPDLASAPRRLVAFLATCPDDAFRDPGRAVELASRSVELSPENGRWWHLLGVAQYCASQYHDAVESLSRSMELRAGGDSFDRLFLAMACWQLGKKQKAREWYAQAAEYIDQRGRRVTLDFTSLDLERFRAQADRLITRKEE